MAIKRQLLITSSWKPTRGGSDAASGGKASILWGLESAKTAPRVLPWKRLVSEAMVNKHNLREYCSRIVLIYLFEKMMMVECFPCISNVLLFSTFEDTIKHRSKRNEEQYPLPFLYKPVACSYCCVFVFQHSFYMQRVLSYTWVYHTFCTNLVCHWSLDILFLSNPSNESLYYCAM